MDNVVRPIPDREEFEVLRTRFGVTCGAANLRVQLEPEGDISIRTEQGQVRVSFDEFRAKFFPVLKRYVPRKGYFNSPGTKCVEIRPDGVYFIMYDGSERRSITKMRLWDRLIGEGSMIEGEVRRFVNTVSYEGGIEFVEIGPAGGVWVYEDGRRETSCHTIQMARAFVAQGFWKEL